MNPARAAYWQGHWKVGQPPCQSVPTLAPAPSVVEATELPRVFQGRRPWPGPTRGRGVTPVPGPGFIEAASAATGTRRERGLKVQLESWRGAIMRLNDKPDGLSVFCCPVADDSPRDKIVSPRMGDWFFDARGWVRRVDYAQPGAVTHTAYCSIGEGKAEHVVETNWPWLCAECGLRPMTPGEVEAFERDGTRPESAS